MRLGGKKSCSKSIVTIMQFSSSLIHWHHWNIHEYHQLHHLVELLNLSTTLSLHQLRESLKLKWNYIPIGGAQGRSCLCNRSARGNGSAHHCKLGSHLQYQRASTRLRASAMLYQSIRVDFNQLLNGHHTIFEQYLVVGNSAWCSLCDHDPPGAIFSGRSWSRYSPE